MSTWIVRLPNKKWASWALKTLMLHKTDGAMAKIKLLRLSVVRECLGSKRRSNGMKSFRRIWAYFRASFSPLARVRRVLLLGRRRKIPSDRLGHQEEVREGGQEEIRQEQLLFWLILRNKKNNLRREIQILIDTLKRDNEGGVHQNSLPTHRSLRCWSEIAKTTN